MNPFDDDDAEFVVLINDEGQHSLWPSLLEVPAGWTVTGPRGQRQVCLAWVETNWVDMRPVSLRRQMDADGR